MRVKMSDIKKKLKRYFELQQLAFDEIVDTGNATSAQVYVEEQDEIREFLENWCKN